MHGGGVDDKRLRCANFGKEAQVFEFGYIFGGLQGDPRG
jgi:hypothetical protein